MLIKLAALGAVGFAGYSYLTKQRAPSATPALPPPETPEVRVAGGPLSSAASVQHSADQPPAAAPA